MVRKKYKVLRSGTLFLFGGEIPVSLKENSFGEQYFSSEEQFQKQVEAGLIVEVLALPSEESNGGNQ